MSHRSKERLRRARRNARRGYTLIEVMTALALLMLGATGIFAIQTGATVANMEARRMGTANQVAQLVLERIRRDALLWRSGGPTMNLTELAATQFLSNAPAAGSGVSAWMNVPNSYAFDYYGNDTTVAADMVYCAQMRFDWVYYGVALRTDVRVHFPRRGDGSDGDSTSAVPFLGCAEIPNPSSTYVEQLHFVHATTTLRWTAVPP